MNFLRPRFDFGNVVAFVLLIPNCLSQFLYIGLNVESVTQN